MKVPVRFLLLVWILGLSSSVAAEERRLALGAKFSSIGPQLDVTYGLNPALNTRLVLQYSIYDELDIYSSVRYAGSLLLDWHPGGKKFRLSGGLGVLGYQYQAYIPAFGDFREIQTEHYRPYIGVGWGNALASKGRWGLSFDVGAFGGGGVSILDSSGSLGAAAVSNGAETEVTRVRIISPDWLVVVSTGISFRF